MKSQRDPSPYEMMNMTLNYGRNRKLKKSISEEGLEYCNEHSTLQRLDLCVRK